MAKLIPIEVGYCTHPMCMAIKGGGLKQGKFPAYSYIIECKNGIWLWDTGYAGRFMKATSWAKLYRAITPVHYDEDQDNLFTQLKKHNIHNSDISGVIVSHFHADHIAGLKDLKHKQIVGSEELIRKHSHKTGLDALMMGFIPELLPQDLMLNWLNIEHWQKTPLPAEFSEFEYGYKFFNQDEIILINLPGHAVGHIGAIIQTNNGPILLASDSAWEIDSISKLRGPSNISFIIQDNKTQYYQTLHKLNKIWKQGIPILLSHNTESNKTHD